MIGSDYRISALCRGRAVETMRMLTIPERLWPDDGRHAPQEHRRRGEEVANDMSMRDSSPLPGSCGR